MSHGRPYDKVSPRLHTRSFGRSIRGEDVASALDVLQAAIDRYGEVTFERRDGDECGEPGVRIWLGQTPQQDDCIGVLDALESLELDV